MSLDRARVQDVEPSRLAAASDRAEQRQAYGMSETDAAAAPTEEQIPVCWGRPDASCWLPHTDVNSQDFSHTSEELYVAATLCAAGLQVSRKTQLPELELHTFNLATSANELVTGWWKG